MTKQEAKQTVSPAVIEAQARLLAMRVKRQRSQAGQSAGHAAWQDGSSLQSANKQLDLSATTGRDPLQAIGDLPDHLGWGSQRYTQALQQSLRNKHYCEEKATKERLRWLGSLQSPTPVTQPKNAANELVSTSNACRIGEPRSALSLAEAESGTIKLHPDIGLGILRKKMAAAGRVWLLLRWIDRLGSGQIEIAQARKFLCDHESAVRVCGWRQLRRLIAQGEGIFWTQCDGRLWLQSIPKVALALGIERLAGRPVALPVKNLIQGIGQVRAHLFASFHSGRKQAGPISRATLTRISQVSPRSQQNYEQRSRVRKLKNFAVGHQMANDNAKEQAWQHGSACFNWHDKKGAHGTQNTAFIAWQLPNSYLGPHEQRSRGRQRKFNRELAVLFTKGMTGNDHFAVEKKPKRYFDAAKKAARAQSHSQTGVYWQGKHPGLWYFMEPLV